MMVSVKKIGVCTIGCLMLALSGCLENDIPYPVVEAAITAFETEGMTAPARINASARTVSLTVNDSVNLGALRLTRLLYTEGASLSMTDSLYADKDRFPSQPFGEVSQLPMSANTRLDLRHLSTLTLSTYQDYHWTVSVKQEVERRVAVEGQIGDAIIDEDSHSMIIYVTKRTPLSRIKVLEFSLGGRYGTIVPNVMDSERYPDGFDFRSPVSIMVRHGWEEAFSTWRVFVYHGEEDQVAAKTSAFARTVSATLQCSVNIGQTPTLEYRVSGMNDWNRVDPALLRVDRTLCTAELTGLQPATTYDYRFLAEERPMGTGSFETTEAIPLENGSLDSWSQVGKLWNPWAEGSESFWDTGNRGATTISESNSCPTTETWNGQGKAALLESKYLVLKFAAGNIFTGQYVATDGTNGVLDFGRPFHAFPTKLRFHYKYQSSVINRIGDTDLQWLKGRPDSCSIYIILADWEKPFTIKTRKSERSLLDPQGDEHILAYSVLETSQSSDTYQECILPIDYHITDRQPKYIVVVASASKYGDYFVGGDASKLWIDDFELLYE